MPKYVVFSLFVLLSCGLSAQTFSFKDSADVAAFAKWVKVLENSGKGKTVSNSIEESARKTAEDKQLLNAAGLSKKYADLQGKALEDQLKEDAEELHYVLFVASNEYKAKADKYNKAGSADNPSAARNAMEFSKISKEYWEDMDYVSSFLKEIQANGADSYDVTYLRRAGGLINAMTFALNKKSDKFYKKLKGQFVLLTKSAAVDFAEK